MVSVEIHTHYIQTDVVGVNSVGWCAHGMAPQRQYGRTWCVFQILFVQEKIKCIAGIGALEREVPKPPTSHHGQTDQHGMKGERAKELDKWHDDSGDTDVPVNIGVHPRRGVRKGTQPISHGKIAFECGVAFLDFRVVDEVGAPGANCRRGGGCVLLGDVLDALERLELGGDVLDALERLELGGERAEITKSGIRETGGCQNVREGDIQLVRNVVISQGRAGQIADIGSRTCESFQLNENYYSMLLNCVPL